VNHAEKAFFWEKTGDGFFCGRHSKGVFTEGVGAVKS
jgi:hypothetical protein